MHFPEMPQANAFEEDREECPLLRWRSPCSTARGTVYMAEAEVWVEHNPQTTWNFVANPANLGCFVGQLGKVNPLEAQVAQWELGDGLDKVCWKTAITLRNPPYVLSWEWVEGSVQSKGYVRVQSEGLGSRVRVHLEHVSPGGNQGEVLARLYRDPQRQLEQNLQRLERLIAAEDTVLPN